MTKLRPIFLVIGLLLATLGAAMFLPAIVDLVEDNEDWEVFAFTGTLTLLIGLGLYSGARGTTNQLSTRQAFIMTSATWLTLSFFGALPYYLSNVVPTFTDAYFESMSALTTTGSTVIQGLDFVPPGILLWRGIQQWLGGLGIIVMAVAVFPMLQIGGMQLFKVEAFDTAEKIMPRATQISGSISLVFILITALCAIAYMVAGMGVMDAAIHAMTTVATGGFSTKDASLGAFDSEAVEMVAILFMILGSIPFILYVQAIQGSPGKLWENSQVQVFLILLAGFIAVAWAMHPGAGSEEHHPLLQASFNVTSIMTGTGYATADYGAWAPGANMLFFAIMFVGGCAGSTSCGIKIFRFQVLFEVIKQQVNRIFFPSGIFVMRFNNQRIDENVAAAVMNFFALYFVLFGVFAMLLNLTGLDFITSISAAGTAISNVGPGLGPEIGPSGNFKSLNDTAKWILTAAMLTGRLELFTVMVLFLPRFWRG